MNAAISALTISIALLTATDSAAQESPQSERGFILDAGEHRIDDILNKAATFLGRNYILPPEIGNAPNVVTLQKKLILDAIGCEEVVSQLAYSLQFVVTPVDTLRGIYEVIYLRGQRRADIATRAMHLTPEQVLKKARVKMVVLTAIPLEHIDAMRAQNSLRPFFMTGGNGGNPIMVGAAASGSLMIQGFADQVAAAIRLLRDMDTPQANKASPELQTQLNALRKQQAQSSQQLQTLLGRLETLEQQFRRRDTTHPARGSKKATSGKESQSVR